MKKSLSCLSAGKEEKCLNERKEYVYVLSLSFYIVPGTGSGLRDLAYSLDFGQAKAIFNALVEVAEYYPDLLSNYSNSSGTISYDTIITPRKAEYRELRYAAEGTMPREQCYYLRELELLPPPIIPEVVDWDLVKRINKLLVSKEKAKKTVEVQRAEKGTVEQSKKVIGEALSKFLSQPTGMAMNISTVSNSKPARLAIKVCPTEWIRTPTTPLVTMEALEKAFNNDPYYISEADLVQEQTELFKKRVQKRQQRNAARAHMRPTFPKDPPAPESRSYGPAAMDNDSLVASDPKSDEDT